MQNKMINRYILLVLLFFVSNSVYAETKLQALCSKSMEQVAAGHASTKNITEIKRKIDKEYYKSRRLRSFLKNQWLTEIRKVEDFTPNNFFVKKDEYVKKCVQFMRPRR